MPNMLKSFLMTLAVIFCIVFGSLILYWLAMTFTHFIMGSIIFLGFCFFWAVAHQVMYGPKCINNMEFKPIPKNPPPPKPAPK